MLVFQPAIPIINLSSGEVNYRALNRPARAFGSTQMRIYLDNPRHHQYYVTIQYCLAGIIRHNWTRDKKEYHYDPMYTIMSLNGRMLCSPDKIELMKHWSYKTRFVYMCNNIEITHVERSKCHSGYYSPEGTFLVLVASTSPIYQGKAQLFLYGLSHRQAVI